MYSSLFGGAIPVDKFISRLLEIRRIISSIGKTLYLKIICKQFNGCISTTDWDNFIYKYKKIRLALKLNPVVHH